MLALDVGSSSVRAQQFDERGEAAGELRREEYESDDPAEVAAAVLRVLGDEEPDATSCFAHSLVAVDEDWNALTPILGWRDTRSADAARRLAQRLDVEAIHARTGAFLHPSFWPAKLAWLAEDGARDLPPGGVVRLLRRLSARRGPRRASGWHPRAACST